MLAQSVNYEIFPSVVRTNTPTEMVIAPTERSFLLFEGETYEVVIIPTDADEPSYNTPTHRMYLSLIAKDGVLRFSHCFEKEQEYTVLLKKDGKEVQSFAMYALEADLYALRPMKGDLHGHSYRSDGKRDPAALAGHYREQGFDFFALTDHNRYYPGTEIDEVYKDVKLGITRVKGEEVHALGSVVHVVHVGGNESVCERYVNKQESFFEELAPYFDKIPADVPEQYHDRYAKCLWSTDYIHRAGGIAIFAHPYWRPEGSRASNVCEELSKILLKSGMFDAYELMGGIDRVGNNRSAAFWNEMRAEGCDIPVVGSSDVHSTEGEPFGNCFTVCFAADSSNEAIADAVKRGYSLAVEGTGVERTREYRCYGKLRLVHYTHFLLKNFFTPMQRICQGEGVAMRAYAMCDAPRELIELQVKQSEDFRARFFGQKPARLPNGEIMDHIARARERQLQGPISKGSTLLNVTKVSRQL